MTNVTNEDVERVARDRLTDAEQMVDAQRGCLCCKLCGGKAVISDAGPGHGYYIRCENSRTFHRWKGCMIENQRVSGWAYNVMDWWNRLHAATLRPQPASEQVEAMRERCAKVAEEHVTIWEGARPEGFDHKLLRDAGNETAEDIAAAIRALEVGEKGGDHAR